MAATVSGTAGGVWAGFVIQSDTTPVWVVSCYTIYESTKMSNHYPFLLTLSNGFNLTPITEQTFITLNQVVANSLAWSETEVTNASWTWYNKELATISIEMVRDLILELNYASYLGKPRVIGLLAAEKLSSAAQHALLKSLEEPPEHTIIVLATETPQSLLDTIKSRCRSISLLSKPSGNDHTPTTSTPMLSDLTAFVTGKINCSHGQLITLAESYKDRGSALIMVDQLIGAVHHQLIAQPDSAQPLAQSMEYLLTAREQLQANTNVQLTLEHCFFEIKCLF